jgi:hypothetical protein
MEAIKGSNAAQPKVIAMKDGLPFGLAGSSGEGKNPAGEWAPTFAILARRGTMAGRSATAWRSYLNREDYEQRLSAELDPRALAATQGEIAKARTGATGLAAGRLFVAMVHARGGRETRKLMLSTATPPWRAVCPFEAE